MGFCFLAFIWVWAMAAGKSLLSWAGGKELNRCWAWGFSS